MYGVIGSRNLNAAFAVVCIYQEHRIFTVYYVLGPPRMALAARRRAVRHALFPPSALRYQTGLIALMPRSAQCPST
jgi:hypothetical protein